MRTRKTGRAQAVAWHGAQMCIGAACLPHSIPGPIRLASDAAITLKKEKEEETERELVAAMC